MVLKNKKSFSFLKQTYFKEGKLLIREGRVSTLSPKEIPIKLSFAGFFEITSIDWVPIEPPPPSNKTFFIYCKTFQLCDINSIIIAIIIEVIKIESNLSKMPP